MLAALRLKLSVISLNSAVYYGPLLRPIPIPTLNVNPIKKLWIWLTTIRKWEVAEDWQFTLPDGARIIIPKGFIFDGTSVPRPLWSLMSPTDLLLIPSLVHDFAYRYDYLWAYSEVGGIIKYKEGAGRHYWDKLFRDVGRKVNGMAYIDYLSWFMLKLFGWYAWSQNRRLAAADICL